MSAQLAERLPPDVAALRTPPSDVHAEQAVLGALMLAPTALPKVADWLTEADFFRADHRAIYRAVTTLAGQGQPVDPITLADWFDAQGLGEVIGGSAYLVELTDATASAANVVAYAEIVVQKSRLRQLIDVGTRLTDEAWARGSDPQQVASDATHSLATLAPSKLRDALEPVKGAMQRMHATLMERYQRGPTLLGEPWPWKELNDCTKGLRDGVLYVVGARPSVGKSVFGLQTAVFHALRGHRTAVFSVEMGAEECMARAVACVGEIPHDWVENPAKNDPDAEWHWSRLSEATAKILASPLLIDETPGLTAAQLVARARRAHLQAPLRLILIDHLHDMATDPKREIRHEYGAIVQACKMLAKELGCPVILLAQLNRGSAKRQEKQPILDDLRETGEIEQKADVVLFLHRDDYYHADSYMKGVVEVCVAKGRNIKKPDQNILLQNVFSEMRLADWIGARPVAVEPEQKNTRGFGRKPTRSWADD